MRCFSMFLSFKRR